MAYETREIFVYRCKECAELHMDFPGSDGRIVFGIILSDQEARTLADALYRNTGRLH